MKNSLCKLGVLATVLALAVGLPAPGAAADKKSASPTEADAGTGRPGSSKRVRTPKPAAVNVTKKSFQSLEKEGQLTLSSPKLSAEGARENRSLDEAMGAILAEQLGKTKLVDRYTEVPAADGKRFARTEAGNYVTRLGTRDGRVEQVVLLGPSFATRELSETLAELGRPMNAESNYAALYEGFQGALAADPAGLGVLLKGMPAPGKLGKKDPKKLLRDLAKRWTKAPPTKIPPTKGKQDCGLSCGKLASPRTLVAGSDGGACYEKSKTGLWATADWQMKGSSTCVKDQGETRGASVAFAINAAVETSIRREHDLCADLSEQHLHYQQKNHWFPIPPNFGDDLNSPSSVFGMMVGDYEFRGEAQWKYNLSPQRTEVTSKTKALGILQGYQGSCAGYADKPCSDTNHQGQYVCAKGTRSCGYSAQIPPAKGEIKVLSYNTFFDVTNSNQTIDVAPMFLGIGLPVVASFQVTQSFLDAADDGWVKSVPKPNKSKKGALDPLRGWHVAMIEGYVRNQDLAKNTPPAAGGGYFIVKNSWGPCVGDGGYWYVPKRWMADHALSMTALTGVQAYGKSSVISGAFNSALQPPEPPSLLVSPAYMPVYPRYSALRWSDTNPTTTSYSVCLREAVESSQGNVDCTLFPVPPAVAAQKKFMIDSFAYEEPYRGESYYWTVLACNAAGCQYSDMNRVIRFTLPNPRLQSPVPGFTATTRSPNFQWYRLTKGFDGQGNPIYDEEVESYRITVGPTPLPAPEPPWEDEMFKHYSSPGIPAGSAGGVQTLRFPVPVTDEIPANLGSTVHWYVEACKTIDGTLECSRFPHFQNRPMQHEGVFYFGTLNLPGGEDPMTFAQACDVIGDVVDSPRCRNCHASITEVTRYDTMQNHGLSPGETCSNCHNPNGGNTPWPGQGEPVWHQPTDAGMQWTGLSTGEVISRMADENTNGDRSLNQIASHVVMDHLVLWAFDPAGGNGNTGDRTPAPYADSYSQAFLVWAANWVANGSSCD
ncbi:MAG: hypothetical protein P8R42_28715 [Candidatus Binatia bacterium]|nr:hypothetical protein [Candidatus Binatia bacterium]